MLKTYFKIALRNLKKRKGYAIINILSLSLGLTGGIFMLIYALDEFSYDTFHQRGERIYRVNTVFVDSKTGNESFNSTNGWPIGKILASDFPEVANVVYTITWPKLDIKVTEETLSPRMVYTSPSFFDIFSFEILKGDPTSTLSQPYHAVITEEMELKLFNGNDGLGKEFLLADSIPITVGAVIKDSPKQSHIQLEILLSQATFERITGIEDYFSGWGNINMSNYLLLKEGTDAEAFKIKAKSIYMDYVGDMMRSWGADAFLSFEPLKDIYLKSEAGNGLGSLGSIERVQMVMGICLFTILLACINFINLSTARAADRYKEVGLRKVVGSSRMALIAQFMIEALLMTLIGLLFAVLFASLMMPVFNELVNKQYSLENLQKPGILAGIFILIGFISLFAGYYPAIHLSRLQPVTIFQGKFQPANNGLTFRKILIVFQFFISITLALGTIVVLNQLEFMQKKELGFAKDEIVIINSSKIPENRLESFKNELGTIPGIQHITYSNGFPGRPGWMGQIAYAEGQPDNPTSVEYLAVDQDYLNTLNLEIIAGRFFESERETDKLDGIVLNEKAVNLFGWENPEEAIGQKIISPSTTPQGIVIGVVRNYHQLGLQHAIHGIAMDWNHNYAYWLSVRFSPNLTNNLLNKIQEKWTTNFGDVPMKYLFLNEDFERLYQSEQRMSKMLRLFAGLTLVISSIGLIGLVSFMVESRTKEMSIRKVLGAKTSHIVLMLSKEFMVLVVVASLISLPVAWIFGKEWLQNFAYQSPLALSNFLIIICAALLLTLGLVGIQTLQAAYRNTVKGLRSQ